MKLSHPAYSDKPLIAYILGIIALVFNNLKLLDLLLLFQKYIFKNNFIKIINYHGNNPDFEKNFELHLQILAKHFEAVDEIYLNNFFSAKIGKKKKPGIIISFDDGIITNYKIAKPLLEKYKLTGWFFIPSEIVNIEPKKQEKYAKSHQINYEYLKFTERIFMNETEITELSKNHVIGSHTVSHYRFENNDSKEKLLYEIKDSKTMIEKIINKKVICFCWVGGEISHYTHDAMKIIIDSGYTYSFMTKSGLIRLNSNKMMLHRTNIEDYFNLSLLKLHLSGIMDLMYYFQRKKVNSIVS
jgi:peptidoglycan/xylan/chitin deacetylase (PgdA/CDA1 family)